MNRTRPSLLAPRLIPLTLLLAFILLPSTVAAQTPAATVKDDSDTIVLQSFIDGALWVPGTFGTGTIPTTGAGTRMMWYPAKAAFRAGQVDGSQWDDGNIGKHSVAFGRNTEAIGNYSTAMGEGTTASGSHSTAMGGSTTASGRRSTAMGSNTTASGNYSTAMSIFTTASGFTSTAMGFHSTASGESAMAMGGLTTASARRSTAMGYWTTAATNQSVSIGECNDSNTNADNTLFVAGNGDGSSSGCISTSDALVLKKDGHLTAADTITSLGGGFELPDGTVLEESGDLGGVSTNGAGAFDLSNEDGLVASGTFDGSGSIPATGGGTRMMWYPDKAAFRAGRVGLGSSGDEWNDGNVGKESVAFGVNTTASGEGAVAMGRFTTASGEGATATGFEAEASGIYATAMGSTPNASGFSSTAMGLGTTASAEAATALGQFTTAATVASLSIGIYNDANRGNDDGDPSTGPLFVVGNGEPGTFSDALVLGGGGNMTIAGTLTEDSDRRLKEQIQPLGEGTLKKLGEIRPVRFRFKNERTHPSGEQLGLIAQDVRKEFPALVSEGSGGTLSVSYSKLTAVLLKGLQEQQGRIEAQQKEIDALRSANAAQEEKIGALEQRLSALEQERSGALAAGGPLAALLLGALALGGIALWRRHRVAP